MAALKLLLLGGFQAELESGQKLSSLTRKSQALLAYLALHSGKAQSREELIALFWSDKAERQGRNSLSQAITSLRKNLTSVPTLLHINASNLMFDSSDAYVDVLEFERLVTSGSSQALELVETIYQGALLSGIGVTDPGFEEWLVFEQRRLEGLAINALTTLIPDRIEQGRDDLLITTAQRLLKLDPLQEVAHRALISCYAKQGQMGLAHQQYLTCVDALNIELGAQPDEETVQVYHDFVQHRIRDGNSSQPLELNEQYDAGITHHPSVEESKPVTVLCVEIKGLNHLLNTLQTEDAEQILNNAMEHMQDALLVHGGSLVRMTENRLMALFGAPAAQEDHAIRGCMAALDMQNSIRDFVSHLPDAESYSLGFRAALDAGRVVIRGEGDGAAERIRAFGLAVQCATQLVESRGFEGIRASVRLASLVKGFIQIEACDSLTLEDFDKPIELFIPIDARPLQTRFEARLAHGIAPIVGRKIELELLHRAHSQANKGQLAALVGEPGVGKSRLLHEFTHGEDRHGGSILECGTASYRKTTPWLPVTDMLRSYFGIEIRDGSDLVREKIINKLTSLDDTLKEGTSAILSLFNIEQDEDSEWGKIGPQERRRQTIIWIKSLLILESDSHPLILVFEDLHWFDQESLALLNSLIDGLGNRQILILVSFRPEFTHQWGGKPNYTQIRVDPLSAEDTSQLLSFLLGDDASLNPVKKQLAKQADGNPLIIEESVQNLIETEGLSGKAGAYRFVDGASISPFPLSVHAIIASRIDHLSSEQKKLLQLFSVIGFDVPYTILAGVCETSEEDLLANLSILQDADFIVETRLYPDLEYSFKHVFTYEVTYSGLLRDNSSELHRRVGEKIEALLGERRFEPAVSLGQHFQLGGVLDKAAEYFLYAANRAKGQYANSSAEDLYNKSLNATNKAVSIDEDKRNGLRKSILEHRGQVRALLGRNQGAVDDFIALTKLAQKTEDRSTEAIALRRKAQLSVTDGAYDEGIVEAKQALAIASEIMDQAEVARILVVLGDIHIHGIRGEDEAGVEFLQRAIPICRKLGDKSSLAEALCHMGYIHQLKGDYPTSIRLIEESLALARDIDDRLRISFDLIFLGVISMDLGNFPASAVYLTDSIAQARKIEAQVLVGIGQLFLGWVEVKRASYSPGLDLLQEALTTFEQAGVNSWIPLVYDIQGECLTRIGELEQALDLFERAIPLGKEMEDPCWQSLGLSGLAFIHGIEGRSLQAQQHYQESLKFCAFSSDMWVRCRAEAQVAWSRVLISQGDLEHALVIIEELKKRSMDMGMQQFIGIALLLEGTCLMRMGKSKLAEKVLNSAFTVSEEIGDQALQRDAAFRLAELHTSIGEEGSAKAIYAIGQELHGKILNSISDDQLRQTLELKYETR